MFNPSPHCRKLLKQEICCAFLLAADSAGNNIAARIAMMAMTTSNSISVNARLDHGPRPDFVAWVGGFVDLISQFETSNLPNSLICQSYICENNEGPIARRL